MQRLSGPTAGGKVSIPLDDEFAPEQIDDAAFDDDGLSAEVKALMKRCASSRRLS